MDTYTVVLSKVEREFLLQFINSDVPIAAKSARVMAQFAAKIEGAKPDQGTDQSAADRRSLET